MQTIDLQHAPLYVRSWNDPNPQTIELYGYTIALPDAPPDDQCINYGLPIEDQMFRKTYIPDDLEYWDPAAQEFFVRNEYHRRYHGVWVFIKGQKMYIPGTSYYFQNYWKLFSGDEVTFRITDNDFFLMWMHCIRDPKCYGLIDFKCRQIGDTEKVLCIIYEYCSRVRNKKAAMQSINEGHIEKSYERLIYAHNKMIWFMKPANRGTDNPKSGLEFMYPTQQMTVNRMKKQTKQHGTATQSDLDFEFPAIGSTIQYGPSKPKHFDGQTYGRYYMDEFGKMEAMDPVETWGVIKPAINSRILNKLVGKALFTSTVEEMKGGNSLLWAEQLWEESDPENRNENGETQNGLYRIFRSALDRAPVDRWGFPKREEELVIIENTIKGFLKSGNMKGLIEFKRKNPLDIQDVFLSTSDESGFHLENLATREYYLKYVQTKPTWEQGNLKWRDGIRDTEVIWEPNPNGRWVISLHPSDHGLQNNAKVNHMVMPKPANIHQFGAGVDPYDQKSTIEKKPSKGAIVVRRRFDAMFDGGKFDDKLKPKDGGADWETNRVVCDYIFRHPNPEDFYEDVILTMVYYGTDFLYEKNRGGGLETYVTMRGYSLYVMDRPKSTKTSYSKHLSQEQGITANENTIEQAFGLLQTETVDYCNTIHHPRYLDQLKSMNWKNRGEKDIGMAGGWALVACTSRVAKPRDEEAVRNTVHFRQNYV